MHSATKFLGGHGTSLGGVVVDLGTFDFAADPQRWPQLTEPYRRVPGGSLVERFGETGSPYITLVKTKYVHDLGPSLSAFNAFQLLQGIETLDLRVARHSESALGVARFLDAASGRRARAPPRPRVEPLARGRARVPAARRRVGLLVRPARDGRPRRGLPPRRGSSSRVCEVVRLVANIGDARSLVAHPASMTHSHMSPTQLAEAGIGSTTVRLSIGLEDLADILADLEPALADVARPRARERRHRRSTGTRRARAHR